MSCGQLQLGNQVSSTNTYLLYVTLQPIKLGQLTIPVGELLMVTSMEVRKGLMYPQGVEEDYLQVKFHAQSGNMQFQTWANFLPEAIDHYLGYIGAHTE